MAIAEPSQMVARAVDPEMVPACPPSDAERRARHDLAALYRIFAAEGWDDLLANHITVRVPGEPEAFLINPFGLLFEEVTASSLVKIDLDGNVLSPTPYRVNQTGYVIHSAVHAARPDAACVVHLHTRNGVAVSMLEGGILPLNQTSMTIFEDVASHEYEGVALDLDERGRLAADLGTRNLMLLRNHGILVVGRSIGEAFARTYFLEWSCDVQLRALSAGRPLHEAHPGVIEKTAAHLTSDSMAGFADLVWPAMLRRARRIAPDFVE